MNNERRSTQKLIIIGIVIVIAITMLFGFLLNRHTKSSRAKQQEINGQSNFVYSPQVIDYEGFNALITQGVASDQLTQIEQQIFDFSNSIHKEFQTVTLDDSSLVIVFHDPTSINSNTSATFSVNTGDTTYKVRAEYPDFGINIYTRIFDNSGGLLYNSSVKTN